MLIVIVAFGPSPTRVTPARVMLYFAPGVKFSRWCFISEADKLQHSDEMRFGKRYRKLPSQSNMCSCVADKVKFSQFFLTVCQKLVKYCSLAISAKSYR